jgi:hypothetical protein
LRPTKKETTVLQALHAPAPSDAASEAHRQAYNAAFHELELNWYWDPATFSRLQPYGRAGVLAHLEAEHAHMLRAYSPEFLVGLIEETKERRYRAMGDRAGVPASLLAA